MSLVPYRLPDNQNKDLSWPLPVPANIVQFQLNAMYRLPLWELVYHDCVVSTWWWGDYNNRIPALWDRSDLFNMLYGSMPMFRFTRAFWEENKEHFVRSYKHVCGVSHAVGYSEMTDHRALSKDWQVQQTEFANGVTVTVNFGSSPFTLSSGQTVVAGGFVVKAGA